MKRYINLNTHSNYAKGETIVTPEEIVEFAVKDGAMAIALTDFNSVQGFTEFSKAAEKYKDKGFKPIYGVRIYGMDPGKSTPPRKIILLAKNQVGLKNIYKIMSSGYMKGISEEEWPCVSYEDIQDSRDGVLVGLECTRQDLSEVVSCDANSDSEDKLKSLIDTEYAVADYVEIKPLRHYLGVTDNHSKRRLAEESVLKYILKEIVRGLKPRPAVAANGSSCITEQDELCFDILHHGGSGAPEKAARFLTTEEMLEEYTRLFSEEEMAQELVLDNPNAIADMVGDVIINDNNEHPFTIDNADEKLTAACEKALRYKYGDTIPVLIRERYESEINNIISRGFASRYVLASLLAEKSRELGYLHNLRGCAGGSFVGYLMAISETNPLPPHYYCPRCKRVEFADENMYHSGFDLFRCAIDRKTCPNCGEQLIGDGHNIPAEFFTGYDGDAAPDFAFNFASDIQEDMVDYLEEIFGKDKIFYAGTMGQFSDRRAEQLTDYYCLDNEVDLSPAETNAIKNKISSVCQANGKHPGRIVIVPEDKEIFEFTPIGYYSEYQLRENMKPQTLMEYRELPLEHFDILGHDMLTKLKLMEEFTGVSARSINFCEIDISGFFGEGKFKGLPYDNDFVRSVSRVVSPIKFSDLVRISGFAHGADVWIENGEGLAGNVCDPGELIAHREDVMLALIKYGIDRKTAFELAEMTCKGKARSCLTSEQEMLLLEHGVPEWYIDSMKKIRYLFPKAHSTEYVTDYLRMIWYKLYHPVAFYAAVLTADDIDFDYNILTEGEKRIELQLDQLNKKSDDEIDCFNSEFRVEQQKKILELALECNELGIIFFPADINASEPRRFIPENGAIRIPLTYRIIR